ncbi:hypothetical protein ACQVP2_35055 [Methylobacterium aquaticum]|uniref:hypothetical protein n=1 Tax=Methylobacterium aquaticum TaxID=270351 RepID=UPI003D17097F
MSDRPTPFDVICDALRPGFASGILENRARRVIEQLIAAGFVFEDLATVASAEAEREQLIDALAAAQRMIDEALPCFDWGKSPLSAHAIRLLNETPLVVRAALAKAEARG